MRLKIGVHYNKSEDICRFFIYCSKTVTEQTLTI
jgi:hypothetical protein